MATLLRHLTIPDEPLALKTLALMLLEQAPEQGLPLVLEGRWIADPLWAVGDDLAARGLSRERFGQIVADYANELRLWVVGERPWGAGRWRAGWAAWHDGFPLPRWRRMARSEGPRGRSPCTASESLRTLTWRR